MKRFLASFFALMITLTICGQQRKIISQVKDNIKKGNNLENAEKSIRELLKDSANKKDDQIWLLLFNSVKKQYEQGNEKLYLKQNYDTANLFNLSIKMFQILESFDSVDAAPNEQGRVKIKYRKKHSEYLNSLRPNLFSGGSFFLKKQKYKEAETMYNTYMECADQPLFGSYNYKEKDAKMPEAAYWVAYCGYKMNEPETVIRNSTLAMQDTAHNAYMLQYLAESYLIKNDTAQYLSTITSGFNKYPKFQFFFPRLIEYYESKHDYSKALELENKVISSDSANTMAKFAKSTTLLNMGSYSQCITLCKELIAQNDTLPDIILNTALAYFNRAVKTNQGVNLTKLQRKSIQDDYKSALPYFEKYRKMMPQEEKKWALPLYTIYLNLNYGEKFKEIDSIINKKQ